MRTFEYIEKHYPDQYLKIKITLDQENYDLWKTILDDDEIKDEFKDYEIKYKGKLILDILADPLPEKIEELEEEKIIPMLYFVHKEDVNNLGDYEENDEFQNSTGDAPEDIGFREITNGPTSEIEWHDEVISMKNSWA